MCAFLSVSQLVCAMEPVPSQGLSHEGPAPSTLASGWAQGREQTRGFVAQATPGGGESEPRALVLPINVEAELGDIRVLKQNKTKTKHSPNTGTAPSFSHGSPVVPRGSSAICESGFGGCANSLLANRGEELGVRLCTPTSPHGARSCRGSGVWGSGGVSLDRPVVKTSCLWGPRQCLSPTERHGMYVILSNAEEEAGN